jgi:membrane protein DedA with SNARE-associated domain/rhodanese-related sulfurtransferase
MPIALDFFVQYAYLVIFLWVLTEQLGIPVPSTPLLLMAGTLTATHKIHLELVVAAALAGSLIADTIWYLFGKKYGAIVVRLLVAKFIPGLGSVAAPIAGQISMGYGRFVFFDAGGILLWVLSVTLSGRFFGDLLKRNANLLSWAGHFFGAIFVLLFLGFLGYRMLQRRAFLKSIRMARIEPRDLKRMMDNDQKVFIIDLRHPLDYLPDPRTLPGALSLTPDKLLRESDRIPRDQEIVLFCTCPSEATAARMALTLRKMGIQRVRPLRGGYDEWKRLGFPLVDIAVETAA